MKQEDLIQDLLNEVSSRIIDFWIQLDLLISSVKSSDYFRSIKSLRTCIMASQSTGNLKIKLHICGGGIDRKEPKLQLPV